MSMCSSSYTFQTRDGQFYIVVRGPLMASMDSQAGESLHKALRIHGFAVKVVIHILKPVK